jgi:hypothetical protein
MPEISLFYGIRVTMYYDDHNPPHFHAEYNGNKAIIEILGLNRNQFLQIAMIAQGDFQKLLLAVLQYCPTS